MTEFKKVAVEAALNSGKFLKRKLAGQKNIQHKGVVDIVTEADYKSEQILVEMISKKFPNHDFLAEEGSEKKTQSEYLWLIDPLDGTTNYAHGFPVFSVSIGLQFESEIILGVIYDPNLDELFMAEKGKGAFLNEKPIHVSKTNNLNESLLITGFPYTIRENPGRTFEFFQKFTLSAQGVRRCGSAALDLCSVACGRIDGFWEQGLKPWDMAAGSLILKEAGGRLSKFDSSDFEIYYPEILATNGKIHEEMIKIFDLHSLQS